MDINRLRWASRRGMLELDLILQPFVEQIYSDLPEDQQRLFHKLLTCEDQDLFAWLLHSREPEDADMQRIVRIVRNSRDRTR